MKLAGVTVKLVLPYFGGIEGKWQPDDSERAAAWEMYVELATRVAMVQLPAHEGLMREALTSLYSLFDVTRGILRKYGPGLANAKRGGDLSFGYVSVAVLNGALRPLLTKWHPLLADYESRRESVVPPSEHEAAWSRREELRSELAQTRQALSDYAEILARVAGIEPIHWSELAVEDMNMR